MNEATERAMKRAEIRGYVAQWAHAVEVQTERTIATTDDLNREVQAHFFAVALANLHTAVWWGRGYCDMTKDGERSKALTAALDTFDALVPHLFDVRNIGEHFEKYADGKGDLQRPERAKNKERRALGVEEVPIELSIWWEADNDNVGVNVLGRRLDVAVGAAAGAALAARALEALS